MIELFLYNFGNKYVFIAIVIVIVESQKAIVKWISLRTPSEGHHVSKFSPFINAKCFNSKRHTNLTLKPWKRPPFRRLTSSNAYSSMNILEFQFEVWIQIDDIQALVWMMALLRPAIIWTNDGDITDAYMRHLASMS